MVDNLGGGQQSSDVLLHNVSVFENPSPADGYFPVTVRDDRPRTMRIYLREQGIPETLESLVMHYAVTLGLVRSPALRNTAFGNFSRGWPNADQRISVLVGA